MRLLPVSRLNLVPKLSNINDWTLSNKKFDFFSSIPSSQVKSLRAACPTHVSLVDRPEYIAVSYCWGEKWPKKQILLNGASWTFGP